MADSWAVLQSLYQQAKSLGVPDAQIPQWIQSLNQYTQTGQSGNNYGLLTGQAQQQNAVAQLNAYNLANEARANSGQQLLDYQQRQQQYDNTLAGDPFKIVDYLNNVASLPKGVAANPMQSLIGAGVTIKPYQSDPQNAADTQALLQKMYGYANPTSATNPAPTGQAKGGEQMLQHPVVGIDTVTKQPVFTAGENGPEGVKFIPQKGVSQKLDKGKQAQEIGAVMGHASGGGLSLHDALVALDRAGLHSAAQVQADPRYKAAYGTAPVAQVAQSDPMNGGDYRYGLSQGTYNSPNAGSAPLGNGSYIRDASGHLSAVANPDSTFQNQYSQVVNGATQFHAMTPEERQALASEMQAQDTQHRLDNMAIDSRDHFNYTPMLNNMFNYGTNWGANAPSSNAYAEKIPGTNTPTGRMIAYNTKDGPVYATGGGPGAWTTAATDWSSGQATGDARNTYRPQMAGQYGGLVANHAAGGGLNIPQTAGMDASYDPSKAQTSQDNQMGAYATDMFNTQEGLQNYKNAMEAKGWGDNQFKGNPYNALYGGGSRQLTPAEFADKSLKVANWVTAQTPAGYHEDPNSPGYAGGPNWAQTYMGRSPNPWGLNGPSTGVATSPTTATGGNGTTATTPGQGQPPNPSVVDPAQAAAKSLYAALKNNPFASPEMLQALQQGLPVPPGAVTDRFRQNVDPTLLTTLEAVNQGFGYRPDAYWASQQKFAIPSFTGYYRAGS